MLRAAWEQHRGTLCRGVNWDAFGLDTLQQVAKCVGGRGLAGLLRLLAQDHGGWSGARPLGLWCSAGAGGWSCWCAHVQHSGLPAEVG